MQDGISRSYDWVGLGIVPTYIVRQVLLTVLMAAAYFGGLPLDAVTAMVLSAAAIWLPALCRCSCSTAGSATRIEPGPKAHDVKLWISTALPILMAEGFYLLLTHADLLMLQQFRSPEDVAVYYAAVKTLALVAFIYFSIAATTAHRVAAYHAAGDRDGLADFMRKAIALDVLAVAGRDRRAARLRQADPVAVRPAVHRRLSPDVHPRRRPAGARRHRPDGALPQRDRRAAHLRADLWRAFAVNIALCVVLIPPFGAAGAAIAISTALIVETIALVVLLKRRMGLTSSSGAGATSVRSHPCTARSSPASGWRSGASTSLRRSPTELRDLAARALTPNVFYEPAFMAASAPVFGRDVMAGLVWRRGCRSS